MPCHGWRATQPDRPACIALFEGIAQGDRQQSVYPTSSRKSLVGTRRPKTHFLFRARKPDSLGTAFIQEGSVQTRWLRLTAGHPYQCDVRVSKLPTSVILPRLGFLDTTWNPHKIHIIRSGRWSRGPVHRFQNISSLGVRNLLAVLQLVQQTSRTTVNRAVLGRDQSRTSNDIQRLSVVVHSQAPETPASLL